MSLKTAEINSIPFTSDEVQDLARLLKHPQISKLIEEVKKNEDKNKDN